MDAATKAVIKSSNVKSKKVHGIKKNIKKCSKRHLKSITINEPVAKIVEASTIYDDLPLPTQQLVSSYFPWFEVLTNEPTGKVDESSPLLNDIKAYANKLFEIELSLYQRNNKKLQKDTNSSNWVKTAATAGIIGSATF